MSHYSDQCIGNRGEGKCGSSTVDQGQCVTLPTNHPE